MQLDLLRSLMPGRHRVRNSFNIATDRLESTKRSAFSQISFCASVTTVGCTSAQLSCRDSQQSRRSWLAKASKKVRAMPRKLLRVTLALLYRRPSDRTLFVVTSCGATSSLSRRFRRGFVSKPQLFSKTSLRTSYSTTIKNYETVYRELLTTVAVLLSLCTQIPTTSKIQKICSRDHYLWGRGDVMRWSAVWYIIRTKSCSTVHFTVFISVN